MLLGAKYKLISKKKDINRHFPATHPRPFWLSAETLLLLSISSVATAACFLARVHGCFLLEQICFFQELRRIVRAWLSRVRIYQIVLTLKQQFTFFCPRSSFQIYNYTTWNLKLAWISCFDLSSLQNLRHWLWTLLTTGSSYCSSTRTSGTHDKFFF